MAVALARIDLVGRVNVEISVVSSAFCVCLFLSTTLLPLVTKVCSKGKKLGGRVLARVLWAEPVSRLS